MACQDYQMNLPTSLILTSDITFWIFTGTISVICYDRQLKGDKNIYASWSVGAALAVASVFYSTSCQADTTNHISSEQRWSSGNKDRQQARNLSPVLQLTQNPATPELLRLVTRHIDNNIYIHVIILLVERCLFVCLLEYKYNTQLLCEYKLSEIFFWNHIFLLLMVQFAFRPHLKNIFFPPIKS